MNLVSIATVISVVTSTSISSIAQEIIKVDERILRIVEFVKNYHGFKTGPIYEKYVLHVNGSYIRIVYRDNSTFGRVSDGKIGPEDTISIYKDGIVPFYSIRLDLSNLDNYEEEVFMRLISETTNGIKNANN